MNPEIYEVNGETFRKGQKVSVVAKWPDGRVRRVTGGLWTIASGQAYVDTPFGLVEGALETLESEE
jgi:hypothetical protein